MTTKSLAVGALIGRCPAALILCVLTFVCLFMFPGCSFAPDDAVAATNSADSTTQVDATAEAAPSIDAKENLAERLENPTPSGNVAQRNVSDNDAKQREVAIRQTGSSSTDTSNTAEDAPKKIDTSKTLDLTFDDLAFEMEKTETFKRSMLTAKINSYDGGTVRLRGFIRPSFSQSGLTKFVFVRDNKECCFGPGAALYDCVLVRLAKGKKTEYTVRPVTIEGKFYLKEYKGPDGKVWSIYRMKEAFVR